MDCQCILPIPYPTGMCMRCGGAVDPAMTPVPQSSQTCGCDLGHVDQDGNPKPYLCELHRV